MLFRSLNGIVEAAEFLNIDPSNNEKYKQFLKDLLETIYDKNREATKKYGYMFNTEFVPAESLGVKFAQWDKEDGYKVPENRVLYNSYFFLADDNDTSIIDKLKLIGEDTGGLYLFDRDMESFDVQTNGM